MGYRARVVAVVAGVLLAGCVPAMGGAPADTEAVEREIARLAEGSGGRVGVTAIHVETGRRLSMNGAERFPMASVYKFPIALQVLRRVERGELRLDAPVALTERDYRPAYSPITDFANGTPMTLTVGRLLELMLADSDNTASDALLRLAGGGAAVTARLREIGVRDIDVNRPEAQLISDGIGVKVMPPESEWTLARLRALWDAVPAAEREAAVARYATDPRDTATPDAMADLLARAQRGETLSADTTALLLRVMTGASTGVLRIKGRLPAGTPVAHKSGSMGGTTNDVGIITLPDKTHVAIAIFVKASPKTHEAREPAIAEIARTVYDYFLVGSRQFRFRGDWFDRRVRLAPGTAYCLLPTAY
jgi:beta-lactamase class A